MQGGSQQSPQGGWGTPGPAGFPGYAPAPTMATVARVALLPGERVLYFIKPNLGMHRVWYFIGGIVLLPVLVGIYLIYVGINFEESENHYWVITNQRLFTVNARGKVKTQIGHHEITNLVHRQGAGTNELVVHSAQTFITFRREESHDIPRLKLLLGNLKDPRFREQAPAVPFEP